MKSRPHPQPSALMPTMSPYRYQATTPTDSASAPRTQLQSDKRLDVTSGDKPLAAKIYILPAEPMEE